jgi:hypothetical protein
MANPFLVLGGIAVGIVTAGFGILQVPGWIGAAQDAAVTNDLANVRDVQSAAASKFGSYLTSFGDPRIDELGMSREKSGSTKSLDMTTTSDSWCAVAFSASGKYIAASGATTDFGKGATAEAAAADAGCAATPGAATGTEFGNLVVSPGALTEAPNMHTVFLSDLAWAPGGGYTLAARSGSGIVSSDGTLTPHTFDGGGNSVAVDHYGNFYTIAEDGDKHIHRVKADGSQSRLAAAGRANDGVTLATSPDGTLYLGDVNGHSEMVISRVENDTLVKTHRISEEYRFSSSQGIGEVFHVTDDGTVILSGRATDGVSTVSADAFDIDGSKQTHALPAGISWSGTTSTPSGGFAAYGINWNTNESVIHEWYPSGNSRVITLPWIMELMDMGRDGNLVFSTSQWVASLTPNGLVNKVSVLPSM